MFDGRDLSPAVLLLVVGVVEEWKKSSEILQLGHRMSQGEGKGG